jgi:hypothetical protein
MVTIRIRSMVWFATGAVLALFVSLLVMNAWQVEAAPGDTDTTFVPTTSCRLVDTRSGQDRVGPDSSWGAKETKTVQATGTNGQCTIPSDAVSLDAKVFALDLTGPLSSFLTFWAEGTRPLGSALNPAPAPAFVQSAVTIPLSSTGSFNTYNENGIVNIIIEVNGYNTKDSLKELHQVSVELGLQNLELGESISELGERISGNRVTAASNKKNDIVEPVVDTFTVAMSVTVEAHSVGIIQIVGSTLVYNNPADNVYYDCRLTRGDNTTTNTSDDDLDDTDRRLNIEDFGESFCSTNGTVAVGEGTHIINLVVRKSQDSGNFNDGTLQAIFIPGGTLDNTDET